jgi:hypothetical protein
MLKKMKLAAVALLMPLLALGQTYPSPTYQNVTVRGTLTAASQSFTNPLSVGSGGTGLSSISANALLYGNGTGALQTLGPLTNGQLAIGSTGAAPVAATLTGTTNQVNVATGAGSITLSLPQSIATTSSPTFAGLTLSTTPLGVSSGGSGLATRTAHAVQVGNGTGAITQVAPVQAGYVLTDNGPGNDPTFQAGNSGRLLNVQVFTSSGTYTPTTGTNSVVIEAVGGGGGSGGVAATGAGQSGVAGSGGSGSYAKARFTSGFTGGLTVTIGAAGTAAAAGANAGGNGGTTSIGSIVSCPGGNGGSAGAVSTSGFLLTPANAAATCTITGAAQTMANIGGQGSTGSFILTGGSQQISAFGGSNPLGTGGIPQTGTGVGYTGNGAGAGASGATSSASQAAQAGSAGTKGALIIYEYN